MALELALLAGLLATLLVALLVGYLRSQRHTPAGRHLIAVAAVGLAEALGLLALATGNSPPLWVFAAVYGLADVVAVGWLLLLWRARARARAGVGRLEEEGS